MVMGSPGRVPPALHVAAGERPPLQTWNPDADIGIPSNGAEITYAPAIVVAPPQLPTPDQHPQRKEFPPRGLKAFFDTAGDRPSSSLGFVAHAVQLDNFTNLWLWLPSARRFVPPCMFGLMLQIIDGTAVAEWHPSIPPGHANGSLGTAASGVVSVWFEDYFPASSGSAITI